MNVNDPNYPGEWYWEWCRESACIKYERTLRRNHGHHLTELAVIYVCRTIMEEGLWEISADALSKRVGRRYHRLRGARRIPWHTRPGLTTRCMEKLIAFICAIPRDIRCADALDGVLVYCIEYKESKREGWYREHPTASDGSADPQDIPEGW